MFRKKTMNEIHSLIRNHIVSSWKESEFKDFEITNFNMGRTATGVFSLIIYPRKKLKKGEKRELKVVLDKDKTTLLIAIEVMESLMEEADGMSLSAKLEKKNPKKKESTGFFTTK